MIIIGVEDDGQGVDKILLERKAQERGVESNQSGFDLVFEQGLSTKELASNISGRGVGMGSVRASVENAGGSIKIDSRKGQGTRVVLAFPVSSTGADLKAS